MCVINTMLVKVVTAYACLVKVVNMVQRRQATLCGYYSFVASEMGAAVLLLLGLALCVLTASSDPQAPDSSQHGAVGPDSQPDGECPANEEEKCETEQCSWTSEQGITYSLEDFNSRTFKFPLPLPRGAFLTFHLCSTPTSPAIICHNGRKTPTCITVPGVDPTSTGNTPPRIEQIEPHAPGQGFKLIYEDGDVCQVTKNPRRTVISLPCSSEAKYQVSNFNLKKIFEGEGTAICNYFVEFPPSQYGCPVERDEKAKIGGSKLFPEVWAVSGCTDSVPLRTTTECHYAMESNLTIHGVNFDQFCEAHSSASGGHSTSTSSAHNDNNPAAPFNTVKCSQHFAANFAVHIGEVYECKDVKILSHFELNCKLEKGTGNSLAITVRRKSGDASTETKGSDVIAKLDAAVGYKEAIDFREKFSKFVELGVGGLKNEIEELYRRAFASRGTPLSVLEKLGVTHVKGILLYGPPGSGKTLLARTIAKIMGTDQVTLINGPEVISKYLGESEKNLRAHFKDAHEAWAQYGVLSDLYVIIIDEIDAICKPRGKADQSAAGVAYDALVNQLLTLLDGLNEVHNTIVVGLTNRKELLDPALLRPGRFEVLIEVGLPDEEGRWEIFEIHTRSMRNNSMISSDVNLWELAANTTRFSGAEISGVVRAAASYALERYQLAVGDGIEDASVLVTNEDFNRALLSVNPAYTHSEAHVLSNYLPLGYLPCGEAHEGVVEASLELMTSLKQGATTRLQTVLLYGPRGSGKTTAAVHLATLGKFSFVRILTASDFVGRPELMKVDLLHQTFSDAFKSDSAIVILDDLHRLVEFVKVGAQISVSHSILHTINTLLTATPPQGSKVLVIGTMTAMDGQSLEDTTSLGLPELFIQHFFVPLLDSRSVLTFLAARNIHKFGGGQFSLPSNLEISLQQLVHALECACVQSHAHCAAGRISPAHIKQDHLTECIMTFVIQRSADFTSSAIYGH